MMDVAAVVAVGIAVLVGAAALRVALDRDVRTVFPRLSVALSAAVAVGVAVAVLAAVTVPVALVVAVTAFLVAVAVWTWSLHPLRARRRREPPGSRSITRSVRDLARRDALERRARRYGPVFTSMQFHRPIVCIVGLEPCLRLLRDHRTSLGPSPLSFSDEIEGGFLRYMDDDVHDVYGPMFRRALDREVVGRCAAVARTTVRLEIGAVRDQPDTPRSALDRVATAALMAGLFGVDIGSADGADFERRFRSWAAEVRLHPLRRRASVGLPEVRAAVIEQLERADDPCAARSLRGEDGTISQLAVDNLVFMQRIGAGNLAGLLGWCLEHLAGDRTWADRIRADRSGVAAEGFVWETLRLSQSEYLYRRLLEDVTFDGYVLPAGRLVRLCIAESHRDARIHPDPRRHTDRFVGRRPPVSELCPFGGDRHACNAGTLSVAVAAAVVAELAAAIDDGRIVIRPAGTVTRDFRHWSHWRPGAGQAWWSPATDAKQDVTAVATT